MSKFLFITGTGTDVGKTYVAALIVKKLLQAGFNIGYFKPAMSGNHIDCNGKLLPGDALFVKNFAHSKQSLTEMCPYVFEAAYSPHLAAQICQQTIKLNKIKNCLYKMFDKYDYIVIEGAGGVLCPLSCNNGRIFTIADFISYYKFPCLIVADAGLGTINNLVLTTEYLRKRSINVKGFIINNYLQNNLLHIDNLKMCELMSKYKAIACLKPQCQDFPLAAVELINYFS